MAHTPEDNSRQNRETSSEPVDLLAWGAHDVAYMKLADDPDTGGWAVCDADGEEIAVAESRDLARAIIIQSGLEPCSVH